MPPDDPRALLAEARMMVIALDRNDCIEIFRVPRLLTDLADALEAALDREAQRVEAAFWEGYDARCDQGLECHPVWSQSDAASGDPARWRGWLTEETP